MRQIKINSDGILARDRGKIRFKDIPDMKSYSEKWDRIRDFLNQEK